MLTVPKARGEGAGDQGPLEWWPSKGAVKGSHSYEAPHLSFLQGSGEVCGLWSQVPAFQPSSASY